MVRRQYDRKFEEAALAKLRSMGVNLIPVGISEVSLRGHAQAFFWRKLRPLLMTSRAAAATSCFTQQTKDDWPNTFRAARFVPAVEYIQPIAPYTAMELAAKSVRKQWM